MKLHKINNVNKALDIMKKHQVRKLFGYLQMEISIQYEWHLKFMANFQIRMVNIHAEDIVSGNLKIVLGLVWTIIYHWQVRM